MISAAVWSAIAATFAAISSFLIYRTQRQNYFLSVRPELVLEGWSRNPKVIGTTEYDFLLFTGVKNIGRGPALHIHINSVGTDNALPYAAFSTMRFPVIAVDQTADIDAGMTLRWEGVKPSSFGHRHIPITIEISFLDLAGVRHDTRYSILVGDLADQKNDHLVDTIAPQVMLVSRVTTSTPVWRLKLTRKLESLDPHKVFHD